MCPCSDDTTVSSVNQSWNGSDRSATRTILRPGSFGGERGVSKRLVNRVPPPSSQMWQTS